MFKVICTISGARHEYTEDGSWAREGGASFSNQADADAAASEARARFSHHIRHSIKIEPQQAQTA